MPKIRYQDIKIGPKNLQLVETCNRIIAEYVADGLRLTLRQLYYQLVSRDVIPNQVKEYKRLGCVVNDARLAGLIDWSAIEDRTRNLETVPHWTSPDDIVEACARQFRIDKWADQPTRVEVWIEKEALAGVFDRVCTALDVPFFACRGYTSQSEMWAGAMRFVKYLQAGKNVCVLHFGDHDPSGIDMTRDIEDRLRMFATHHVGAYAQRLSITRVALNMDQVDEYDPPENPAKATDSRFDGYQREFGDSSWELDALEPRVLAALVRERVAAVRDEDEWQVARRAEAEHRALLSVASDEWTSIVERLRETREADIEEKVEAELVEETEL